MSYVNCHAEGMLHTFEQKIEELERRLRLLQQQNTQVLALVKAMHEKAMTS